MVRFSYGNGYSGYNLLVLFSVSSDLKNVAVLIGIFNIVLFFVLLVPWIVRWFAFPKDAIGDLNHPVVANFYPTIAIGMLVIAGSFVVIFKNIEAALIFWAIGTVLTVFFSVAVPFVMFMGEHVQLSHINPSWFIPPVGLLVVPIAGSPIAQHLAGTWKEVATVVNFLCWGGGFFNYLALLAVCIYRFILYHPLPNVLIPTIWINLGPVGAGTVALVSMIKFSDFVLFKEPFYVFGLMLWGFGIWWTLMSLVVLFHYAKTFKIPYAMSWWAFTFPLGAYVASSHLIGNVFCFKTVDLVGFALFWLLVGFWSVTAFNTAVHTYTGAIFKKG